MASLLGTTKERVNFARLCRLLINGGVRVLRELFDKIYPPSSLHGVLRSPGIIGHLKVLKAKKIISVDQWSKLYPDPSSGTSVTSDHFDITLLCCLLRNICNLKPPATGWDNPPDEADHCNEADFVRMRLLRNKLYGHITRAEVNEYEFESSWKEITDVLSRLGNGKYDVDIDRLKAESMDSDNEDFYMKMLEEWELYEKNLMGLLKETEAHLTKKIEDEMVEVKEHITETVKDCLKTAEIILTFTDGEAQRLSEELKKSVLVQTKFQAGLFNTGGVEYKTDQIFTNIKIMKGRKSLQGIQHNVGERDKILPEYSKTTHPCERCDDIFIDTETKELHKSILIIGRAGIGKTFFCQKLLRDWANGNLFSLAQRQDFKFAFLITFRQLNLYDKEELTLLDLLNRSGVAIDERAFDFIKLHADQVLFMFDGFDEYKTSELIVDEKESKYTNDPLKKMPVAIIISKLVKKKIFAQSVVLVTSRPSEGLKSIHFDQKAEILGFDKKYVEEYIGKYFRDNQDLVDEVKKHVLKSKDLTSFCYTPLTCQLVCWCLRFYFDTKKFSIFNKNTPPLTLSELYSLTIEILTSKVHPDSKFRSQPISDTGEVMPLISETLDKLSKLAGDFYLKNKFVFDDTDLREFKFSDKEITHLKDCGLIVCGPGYAKTALRISHDFCFLHLTLQEFLAARFYVMTADIPHLKVDDEVVCKFVAGLAGKERNEDCMNKLIQNVHIIEKKTPEERKWSFAAKCLLACGDKEFAKNFLPALSQEYKITFFRPGNLPEMDLRFMIELICLYNKKISSSQEGQPPKIQSGLKGDKLNSYYDLHFLFAELFQDIRCNLTELHFINSRFSERSLHYLYDLLKNERNISILRFENVTLHYDVSIKFFWQLICQCTTITDLRIHFGHRRPKLGWCGIGLKFDDYFVFDDGDDLEGLSQVLSKNIHLKSLHLNNEIQSARWNELLIDIMTQENLEKITLCLSYSPEHLIDFCTSTRGSNYEFSSLSLKFILNHDPFSEEALQCLCEACKVMNLSITELWLCGHLECESIESLCETLKDEQCSLHSLILENTETLDNDKTKDFIDPLCGVLKNVNNHLMSLTLHGSSLTDSAVLVLFQVLNHCNCKLQVLKIGGSKEITSRSVSSICMILDEKSVKLTEVLIEFDSESMKKIEKDCKTIEISNYKLRFLKTGVLVEQI